MKFKLKTIIFVNMFCLSSIFCSESKKTCNFEEKNVVKLNNNLTSKIVKVGESNHLRSDIKWIEKLGQSYYKEMSQNIQTDKIYNLVDLVFFALENNQNTRQSWFIARQKFAAHGIARSSIFPIVTISTSVSQIQTGGIQSSTVQKYFQPSIELNYKVFQFGSDLAKIESAKQQFYAADLQYNRAIQTVIYEVEKAYYDFQLSLATVKSNLASQEDARYAFEAVSQKHSVGLANKQDFLRAKANLLHSEYIYKSSLSSVEIARASLAEKIGISVSENFKISEAKIDFREDSILEIENCIQLSLKNRSDLSAQKHLLIACEENEKSQKRSFLPEISLNAYANTRKYESQSSWQKNYGTSLSFKWDIFNGFNSTYSILLARDQKRAQIESLKASEINVINDIWSSFYQLKSAQDELISAESLAEASEQAFEAIKIGYENGINSLLDMLSSQKDLSQSRFLLVQSKIKLATSLATLAYKIGMY